jgi:hypothetical protein
LATIENLQRTSIIQLGCVPAQRESSVTRRASRPAETETAMSTTILPHETAEGPQDRAAWQQLLATAPRSTDSVGRATIQVCTASDGRGIFATVDYATWQTEKEEG